MLDLCTVENTSTTSHIFCLFVKSNNIMAKECSGKKVIKWYTVRYAGKIPYFN